MPTYQFEAMDQTGKTVKETIEAKIGRAHV